MINRADLSEDEKKAMRLLIGAGIVFGVLVGAVVGAIFGPQIVRFFNVSFSNLRLYCALIGSMVGGTIAYVKTKAELQRQHEVQRAGKELGLEHPTESASTDGDQIEDYENCIRELIPSEGICTVDIKLCKKLDLATLVIAEVHYTDSLGPNDRHSHRKCTVAYFDVPSGQWPEFTMQPEKTKLISEGTQFNTSDGSFTSYRSYRSTKMLDLVFGDHDIDFEDSPVFSENYYLLGLDKDSVRKIFTPQIRDYFSTHLEMCLTGRRNQLLIYYPRTRFDADKLKVFVKQSLRICKLFLHAVSEIGPIETTDLRKTVNEMPGLLGHVYRCGLVTRKELDEFLSEPCPRNVPANIKRQFYGAGNLFLILFGIFSIAGGMSFVAMATAFGENLGLAGTIAKGGAIAFAVIGAIISWFNIRSRIFHRRLLRNGQVQNGMIVDVETTGVMVEQQAQYRLSVTVNGVDAKAIVYGTAGRNAKEFARRQSPTRFLVGRSNPAKVVWVEAISQEPMG